jgi:transposase InsO family protein
VGTARRERPNHREARDHPSAFIVIKAADEFKTTAPNQFWQTDVTYLKVIGWRWIYLSTILDYYFRYVAAWKLCTTMRAETITDPLTLALEASGRALEKSRTRRACPQDNGPCYIGNDLAKWLDNKTSSTYAVRRAIRRHRKK